MKDEEVERWLGVEDMARLSDFLESVCSGPYSQVTSQSFSLKGMMFSKDLF